MRIIEAGIMRTAIFTLFAILGPLSMFNLINLLLKLKREYRYPKSVSPGIRCVKVMGGQDVKNLGELLQRNQLAFYVANLYHARMSFPPINNDIGDLSQFFSACAPPKPDCVLKHKDVGLMDCDPGDCGCVALTVSKYITPLSHCSTLGVENYYRKTTGYSGCLYDVLQRYFGDLPHWSSDYDAVHYVDVFQRPDARAALAGEVFSHGRFVHLMHALCVLSDRDIIIISNGEAKVPLCGNRTVLANTNAVGAIKISQHARHLAVASNPLGILMMELAAPLRMVLLSESYKKFMWVKMPLVTLVRRDGHLFHFFPGELTRDVAKDLERITPEAGPTRYLTEPQVPHRRWEAEALSH